MRKLSLKLTPRTDGRVCKRVDGRLRIWADETTARRELLALISLRESGRAQLAAPLRPATIREILNAFLVDRETRMEDGRMKKGSFLDYKDAIETFAAAIDSWEPIQPDAISLMRRDAAYSDLGPAHFRHIRACQAKGIGSYMLDRRVQGVRTAFRWAAVISKMIPGPPHYGEDYRKPTKADKRRDKRKSEAMRGERRFSPEHLAVLLNSKKLAGPIKPMVWLALNGGMYAADCAVLRRVDIKRAGRLRLIDTYREKTSILQKFILWPETAKALDDYAPKRWKPRAGVDPDLVFITRHGGPWVSETIRRDESGLVAGGSNINSVSGAFNKLLRALKIKRDGVGFGAFRSTHISAAARHPDVNARMVVRGHQIKGIEEHYDLQDLDRLKAVTDLVYKTLIKPALRHSRRAAKKRKPSHARPRTVGRKRRAA